MNISFSAIHMQAADPQALQQFYGGTLELPAKQGPGGELAIQAGETYLVFAPAENGERPFYHFAFNIPENVLPAAQEWLAGKVELLPHPESGDPVTPWDAWNAHALYFYDPAGNIVELIARHDLPGATDPFGPQSLLYVSEIGLPVADVPAAAGFLQQRLDVPVFSQTGDSFCALGDPHGLLILVKAGRSWWPTNDAHAGVYPLQVILGSGGQEVLQIPDTPYQIGGLGGG